MSYCTPQDLFEACRKSAVLSWASDDSREEETTILSRIDSAISRATDEINLYLSKQYPLPLPFIPLSLKDICVKLSLYQLLSRKGLNIDSADNTIQINKNSATKQLEQIAMGKLDLGILSSHNNTTITHAPSGACYYFPKSQLLR